MKKETRLDLQLLTAVGLTIVGCALLIAGFIVAPVGYISESVLVAFGEILTFVGATFGIDYHYRAVYKRIDINKENKDNKNNG